MKKICKQTPFWQPDDKERAALLRHLMAELPAGHVLWARREGLKVEARDGDRIILRSRDPAMPLAVVRIAWTGRPSMAPFLPETELYPNETELLAALLKAAP